MPVTPEVAAALRLQRQLQATERLAAGSMWAGGDLVFRSEVGTPVNYRNTLRWLHGVEKAAGVPRAGWHGFRHGAATRLVEAGVSLPVVQQVLGHSRISTTIDRYGHLSQGYIAEEMLRGLAGYGDPESVTQSVT